MRAIGRVIILSGIGSVSALQAAPAPENVITVVVSDGAYSGSYTALNPGCLHVKDRNTLGCGWKEAAEPNKTKRLEEAGIQVDTVSAGTGARTGDVVVKFLDGVSGKMIDYSVTNVPLTLTRNGAVQQISFAGKTKDGVRMRVTGTIVQVDEF